eukprot:TRINITY_DN1644_c1_g1_i4.p1 TRINITY_DN1644_c1_g1~~TRINITY_DN1644_c1_g1_i4.p1  ORF type:complete len:177 (+),score=36.60 TRINITY_DN1644_c1_g1_i4:80-610(+)
MMTYHKNSFYFHIFLSFCQMMITYLEVMNLYNCERYSCVVLPSSILFMTFVNAALHRQNIDLYLPIIAAHIIGVSGLGMWVHKYVQTFPNERAEFYDTHACYFCMLFVANMIAVYRYLEQPSIMKLSKAEIATAATELFHAHARPQQGFPSPKPTGTSTAETSSSGDVAISIQDFL